MGSTRSEPAKTCVCLQKGWCVETRGVSDYHGRQFRFRFFGPDFSVVGRLTLFHMTVVYCVPYVVLDYGFIMPSGSEVQLFLSLTPTAESCSHVCAPITTEYTVAAGTMARPT